jgi:hypothetical protein
MHRPELPPAFKVLRSSSAAVLDVGRTQQAGRDGPVNLAFAAGPGIRPLICGELAPARAIATGVVEVLRGPGRLLHRFASTFHLAASSEPRRRDGSQPRGSSSFRQQEVQSRSIPSAARASRRRNARRV